MTADETVYTFWEPAANISGYIRLCIDTWKKAFPGRKVVVLDYGNITDHISPELVSRILCKKMSLPMQSDAIRAAVMFERGGIWLDADTIVTGDNPEAFINSAPGETVMFGDTQRKDDSFLFGAFIAAKRPHADFVSSWCSALPDRVSKWLRYKYFMQWFNRKEWRRIRKWNYCVNAVIEPLSREMTPEQFTMLDFRDYGCMPHLPADGELTSAQQRECYVNYWFTPGAPEETRQNSRGIVMLQNSWTPPEYKKMPAEEFLKQDIRMAALFRLLLNS